MKSNFAIFFDGFLARVKSKDFSVLADVVDERVPLRVLLPYGAPITDHQEFIEGQRNYFENPETSFEYDIVTTEESDNIGFGCCITKVKIREVDSLQQFTNQISFLFKKYDGRWILTFDQNTKLD